MRTENRFDNPKDPNSVPITNPFTGMINYVTEMGMKYLRDGGTITRIRKLRSGGVFTYEIGLKEGSNTFYRLPVKEG